MTGDRAMERATRQAKRTVRNLLLIPALLMWSPLLYGVQAQQIRFVDVDGAFQTFVADINDAGTIVGSFAALGRPLEGGFVRNADGAISIKDYPGAYGTQVTGINNAGDVCGIFYDYNPEDPASEFRTRAFIWRHGQSLPEPLDYPGATDIYLSDINDSGVTVGGAIIAGEWRTFVRLASGQFTFVTSPAGSVILVRIDNAGSAVGSLVSDTHVHLPVRWAANTLTVVSLPVSGSCDLTSIAETGDMLGYCGGGAYVFRPNGTFITVPPSLPNTPHGFNSRGVLIGSFQDGIDPVSGNLRFRGFFTVPTELVDPVPDLLVGASITTDEAELATVGRLVQGVAADGVARVVVRIPASMPAQQFTVRLLNDREPRVLSQSDDEDGALATMGAQTSWSNQVIVSAEAVGEEHTAFLVYRAPKDFPREGMPVVPGAVGPFTQAVEIVRPPVFLIHGLWSDPGSWFGFVPLREGTDPRFRIATADYSGSVVVQSAVPSFSSDDLPRMTAASLGVAYNTPKVYVQLKSAIKALRDGGNPLGLPVASIQADVVGHSLGGIIARTMTAAPDFSRKESFGAGAVHKLVTIDTPHLGSPIAAQLLAPANACLRTFIADRHFLLLKLRNFAVSEVTLPSGETIGGAVADLVEGSPALQRLSTQSAVPVPTAFIAGEYTRWSALRGLGPEDLIGCGESPLANALTEVGWPAVFGGERNDAIVGWNSQIDGIEDAAVHPFSDKVHSAGTRALGFEGPSIQDGGEVPVEVTHILNTPVYVPSYFRRTPALPAP
jgi:pimeloyl-ACP methyl ester carboxylesterase